MLDDFEYEASMGPRSFNRGRIVRRRALLFPEFRFNGAAVFQPRKARVVDCSAGLGGCFNGAAVFQPRKGNYGEFIGSGDTGFNGAAVFQPRKGGNGGRKGGRITGFNGAAVFQPRKEAPTPCAPAFAAGLQWGRGLSTAEGRMVFVREGLEVDPRFNGAAVFQPRKVPLLRVTH